MSSSRSRPAVSVLICGDVLGKFSALSRISTKLNNEKGPFEGMYCVGNFFSDSTPEWELLKSGKFKIPIPCYILGPSKKEHLKYYSHTEDGQIAPNIFYLGKRGISTTSSGLRVGYLSGAESIECHEYTYNSKDITEIQEIFKNKSFAGVDILLTSNWPKYITNNLPPSASSVNVNGSELVSYVAATLKPCYHFAGTENIFFERLPYKNTKVFIDEISHATRFIGLAVLYNCEKRRYVYGITHTPIHMASKEFLRKSAVSSASTESPYNFTSLDCGKKVLGVVQSTASNIAGREKNQSKTMKKKRSDPPMNCWFCLSSDVDEHLIFSLGYDCYLTLAKGWITEDHFLLLPNSHFKSSVQLSGSVLDEIESYKASLKKYFYDRSRIFVCYERCFKSPHMQLQIIGIPRLQVHDISKRFLKEALALNIVLEEIPPYSSINQLVDAQAQYFYLEIKDGSGPCKKFFYIIENNFPLDFARNTLASLLNVPDRADWKKCAQSLSIDDERRVSRYVKQRFQKYFPYRKKDG